MQTQATARAVAAAWAAKVEVAAMPKAESIYPLAAELWALAQTWLSMLPAMAVQAAAVDLRAVDMAEMQPLEKSWAEESSACPRLACNNPLFPTIPLSVAALTEPMAGEELEAPAVPAALAETARQE